MNEIIKGIKEVDRYSVDGDSWNSFEGYEIETSEQKIYVIIDDSQSCCEHAGYLSTPDDPKDFIGAALLKIEIVDTALNKEQWDMKHPHGLDGGDAMFVNFETDRGLFQLTAYNSQNGYYGHAARLISKQLTEERTL